MIVWWGSMNEQKYCTQPLVFCLFQKKGSTKENVDYGAINS